MKVLCATAALLLLVGLFAQTIIPSEASSVCGQSIETGDCKGNHPRWGFARGTCVQFVYGGCGGNDNRFPTEAACREECI